MALTLSDTSFTPLADISDAAPAGENLELDPDFGAMERASEGTPETQYGATINPEIPPDWKEVQALALSLQERTRDIRVMVHLAVARLNLTGIVGFAETLSQIRYQIAERWDHVHPQLDPEDDNDPAFRANTLARLQDPRKVMRPLREMVLARSPRGGAISWRDIAISLGQIEVEKGVEKPAEAFIRGVFNDSDRERLSAVRDGIDLAARELAAIRSAFDGVAGPILNLTDLEKLIATIQKDMAAFEPAAAMAEDVGEAVDSNQPAAVESTGSAAVRVGPVTARSLTSVTRREDALYLLELVSSYFRSNEPSSPVPLLIDRAVRLAGMEFIDILRDLAPNGIDQAQIVAGQPPG